MDQVSTDIAIGAILDPVAAYDLAASQYDDWHWQQFWRKTETPFFDDCVESHEFYLRSRMLDAGCGTGYQLERYGRLFDEAYGIDPSVGMLDRATTRFEPAHLAVGGIVPLPYASGMFELVVCARVLSHISDLDGAIGELARVTAPGGMLLISNIDGEHPYSTTRLPSSTGDILAGTFKHPKNAVLKLLRDAGLDLKSTLTISADGFTAVGQDRFEERLPDPLAWALMAAVPA